MFAKISKISILLAITVIITVRVIFVTAMEGIQVLDSMNLRIDSMFIEPGVVIKLLGLEIAVIAAIVDITVTPAARTSTIIIATAADATTAIIAMASSIPYLEIALVSVKIRAVALS